MRSEFESRETFECIFGDEGGIDLSKDETGEYSFQPSRFAYSFFLVAWQYRQTEVDELHEISVALNTETIRQREQVAYYLSKNAELQKRVDAALELCGRCGVLGAQLAVSIEQALNGGEA